MSFGRKGLAPGGRPAKLDGLSPARSGGLKGDPLAGHAVRKFDITPKPLSMFLCMILFGAGALVLVEKVLDPRGVVINGMITLGPLGADLLFGLLALFAVAAAFAGGLELVSGLTSKTFLTLDGNAVEGRGSPLSRKSRRLSYASIVDVSLSRYKGNHFVKIMSDNGEKIRIGSENFRSKDDFAEFLDLLGDRIASARR